MKLLLFDIDGTLVLTGGAGSRAMGRAFEDLFAVRDAFHGVPMPGRTDRSIVGDAAVAHGISPRELNRFPDAYLRHLRRALLEPGPRKGILPGVRELLDALAPRRDVFLALLTGNYEAAARAKLEYFDLWRYFRCGAYGDAAANRHGLVPVALEAVRSCGGSRVTAADTIIIGDTPLDVECAAVAGAKAIAVATGGYDAAALRAAGAHVVFEDLSDTNAVLAVLDSI